MKGVSVKNILIVQMAIVLISHHNFLNFCPQINSGHLVDTVWTLVHDVHDFAGDSTEPDLTVARTHDRHFVHVFDWTGDFGRDSRHRFYDFTDERGFAMRKG